MAKITFAVAEITLKVSVIISSVDKITFTVAMITSSVAKNVKRKKECKSNTPVTNIYTI